MPEVVPKQRTYKNEFSKYLEEVFQFSNATVTETSLRSLENSKSSWCKVFYILQEKHAFNHPDSPAVRSNRFGDCVYKTFDSSWKNKENDEA